MKAGDRMEDMPSRQRGPYHGGCWEWTGETHKGYGRAPVMIDGKWRKRPVHRLVYAAIFGPVPDELDVCHRCDNRRCFRPDHLFLGTTKDNLDDMRAKGRAVNVVGSRNGQSKLTEADVVVIWHLLDDGRTMRSIADQFGVSHSIISRIASGALWGHVREVAA